MVIGRRVGFVNWIPMADGTSDKHQPRTMA
jgi:hypothetical protein